MKLINVKLIILFSLSSVFIVCNAPVDFDRTNERDPKSPNYKPIGPSNMKVSHFYRKIVQISWQDNSQFESGFIIERNFENEGFKQLRVLDENIEAFVDTTNKFGNYTYRVQAISDDHMSEFTLSNSIKVSHWVPSRPLNYKKEFNKSNSVLLNDGRLLVDDFSYTELFNPNTLSWSAIERQGSTTNHNYHIEFGVLTRLNNGSVLNVGSDNTTLVNTHMVIGEIFNPSTEQWTLVFDIMTNTTILHSRAYVSKLDDGNVLITDLDTTIVYNPLTNAIRSVDKLAPGRVQHSMTKLQDGRILVSGGRIPNGNVRGIADCEIFDPATEKWQNTASMQFPRYNHHSILLNDGSVFVIGGGVTNTIIYLKYMIRC